MALEASPTDNCFFDKVMYNRSVGITGESFFWGPDPIADERMQRLLRAIYPGPAIFPDF